MSNTQWITTMPRSDDPHVWDLICIIRDARNAARRRHSAAAETGHPSAILYKQIHVGLSSILFALGRIAYR